jgi:hypothetical protein
MCVRITIWLAGVALVMAPAAEVAVGYIHFPPMTLQKMCKISTHIRVLSAKKFHKEKGVILFEVIENLKGKNPQITSFKHTIRVDAEGVKPILDWVGDQKRAVMFTIEGGIACGYVFIDGYCYSVDYNRRGQYWLMVRAEPNLSACYHGPAARLEKLVKDVLDGKEVQVPVKELVSPLSREARNKRAKEVNDILTRNRNQPMQTPQLSAEYAKRRDQILPDPNERSYWKIPWRTSVLRGIVDAQKNDRPVMIVLMNGHPLGCT